LKKKRSTHAPISTSEAHSSQQESQVSPPQIVSWTCLPNSDSLEITRDNGKVQQVPLNAVVDQLSDEDLIQLPVVEDQQGRNIVDHRALLLRIHGHFNSSDPTIQPINPEPLKVVPLQVFKPQGIKTWGFMSITKVLTIERNNGSIQMMKPTELHSLSNKDIKDMLSIARDDAGASKDQKHILDTPKGLVEDED
jgi:hypothetical protein